MRGSGDSTEWRVGELGARLGVNPKTIRYYGRIGLLPALRRTPAGYRVFGTAERDQLRFILKAKAVGLTLDEIRLVLGLSRDGELPCARVRELLDQKLTAVDTQLHALAEYREELLDLRRQADRTSRAAACVCGIIEHHETARPDAARKALAVLSRSPASRRPA